MQALYRKYRSLTLDSVVGQEHITAPLAAALTAGKLSHAYLLTGPRGVGKTSVARILAHEINHFPYTLEDNYVDIIEIDAASHTGVDNIRDLLERAELAPTLGTHKVYIIDEVHMLSRSAFNALLKTLEEPPAHVIFLLATTDVEKVPVTILSRTQQLKFRLAPTTTLAAHLTKIAQTEKINITPDAVTLLAELAAGSFRDALSLLDQVSNLTGEITKPALETAFGLASRAIITQILTEAAAGNWPQAIAFLDEVCYNDNIGAIQPQLVEQLVATILDSHMAALYPLAARLAAALADPSALPLSLKVKLAFLEQLPPTTGSALAEPHSPRQDFDNNGVAGTKSLAGRSPSLNGSASAEPVVGSALSDAPVASARLETRPVGLPASGEAGPDAETVSPKRASAELNETTWKAAIESLKKAKPGIYAIIKDKAVDINGDKIILYAGSPFFKKKIDTADTKNLLTAALPGADIIVSADKGGQKFVAPPSVSAIIEVGEEVELDVDI